MRADCLPPEFVELDVQRPISIDDLWSHMDRRTFHSSIEPAGNATNRITATGYLPVSVCNVRTNISCSTVLSTISCQLSQGAVYVTGYSLYAMEYPRF